MFFRKKKAATPAKKKISEVAPRKPKSCAMQTRVQTAEGRRRSLHSK